MEQEHILMRVAFCWSRARTRLSYQTARREAKYYLLTRMPLRTAWVLQCLRVACSKPSRMLTFRRRLLTTGWEARESRMVEPHVPITPRLRTQLDALGARLRLRTSLRWSRLPSCTISGLQLR